MKRIRKKAPELVTRLRDRVSMIKRSAVMAPHIPTTSKLERLRRLMLVLLGLAAAHVAGMVVFEGLSAFEAVWLTMTTLTTVGYGDLSAQTVAGRVTTMLLVFLGGIWTSFQCATLYFEYYSERRELMRTGRWRWKMDNHILILNSAGSANVHYLEGLVCEFRLSRRFKDRVIQIVSRDMPGGLPQRLAERGAVHFDGAPWSGETLEAVDAVKADVIVVLAENDDEPQSDSRTFDIVDRLRELGARGRIIVECVDDKNRARMVRAGADIIVRPLRGYPEMVVRALAAPGAEKILEDMFTSRGDECWRYDVCVSALTWRDLVITLVSNDIGVPVAYRRIEDGRIVINPKPDAIVEADKIFVLVREGNARNDTDIASLLSNVDRFGSKEFGNIRSLP